MAAAVRTDREAARRYLLTVADHPYAAIRQHAAWVLRWLDCAPVGATFSLAPLQDKRGTPCGSAWSENVGPCRALRDARQARGLAPLTGGRL